jgi:hypothetical protein
VGLAKPTSGVGGANAAPHGAGNCGLFARSRKERYAPAPGLEVGIMTQPRISASDCNVLRGAFVKCVIEKDIPQDRWRDEAALLDPRLYG